MKKIKVGLAGYGKGGYIYNAPIISSVEGFEITKILTSRNRKKAEKDYPDANIVEDYSKIINDPAVDLVVVTTPNHLHKEFAKKALEANKHVVLEKPFTPTAKDAAELITLAQQKDKILSVHHNRRWDSDFLTLQKIIKEDKLGKIVEYEAHFDRFRNYVKDSWKEEKNIPGSGILYDLGSHLIDQALVLFGKPVEIFANLRKQRENSEVVDNFELILFYEDLKVTLKAGMLVKELGPTYSLFGRNGTYVKYHRDVQEEALQNGKIPSNEPTWGEEPPEIWGKINTIEEEGHIQSEPGNYRKFYQNIYDTITEKTELYVKPEQARDVIKVIEIAQLSHKEKRIVKFI
ncbi:Gfo/Idh/MocA family oxidoreductase [Salinimicrobium sp. GXAS 041]|uniref:Gfo/Idh/MocA family oxidoreductase n=1 Tax=Salinimicrobium sp. GXAS 041 TaxID=3400806 RepID=UPI003C730EA4